MRHKAVNSNSFAVPITLFERAQGVAKLKSLAKPEKQGDQQSAGRASPQLSAQAHSGARGLTPGPPVAVKGHCGGLAYDFSRISVFPPTRLLMQRKLTVNAPGDAYEQEADRVADQVMRMQPVAAVSARSSAAEVSDSAAAVQRECACGGSCEDCKKKNKQVGPAQVQMKASGPGSTGGIEAPTIVREVLRSPGQPLDPATRAFMEPRFGRDFSSVRVHTDEKAAESAKAVQARAYTAGQNVVFGAGEHAPRTNEGQRLLGHELTHVVQQGEGSTGVGAPVQRQPDPNVIVHETAHAQQKGTVPAPAPQPSPAQASPPKSLKEMGISAQDPIVPKMLPIIDTVFARNPTTKPYITGRLQQGREIAEPGKVIVHKTKASYQGAYEKYSGQSTGTTSLPAGFYWESESEERTVKEKGKEVKKTVVKVRDEIHLPPTATFGDAFHEAVHKMSALVSSYLSEDKDFAFYVNEGLTSLFSQRILKDEGVDDYRDGYGHQRDGAKKLVDYAGLDAVAKWYWTGDRIDLLKKVGVKAGSKNETKDVIAQLKKIMDY